MTKYPGCLFFFHGYHAINDFRILHVGLPTVSESKNHPHDWWIENIASYVYANLKASQMKQSDNRMSKKANQVRFFLFITLFYIDNEYLKKKEKISSI